jgi:ribosomal subunit interface protein
MMMEITWRALDPTAALETLVRQKAQALTRYCDHILACRVAIEAPHRRHRHGQRYRVRIELTVPGAEIVVGHPSEENGAREDLRVAIRDAFRALRRRLQHHLTQRRQRVPFAALLA